MFAFKFEVRTKKVSL